MKARLKELWYELYEGLSGLDQRQLGTILDSFICELDGIKEQYFMDEEAPSEDWYKDSVVYSAYVDLFNRDFAGLTEKLDYLQDLGVDCLWLLPILDSPMKDAGFDISDYDHIRPDLLSVDGTLNGDGETVFAEFVHQAHAKGIRLIFDIAMNHCSEEHPWFQEGRLSQDSKYRDYFIWADDDKGYSDARIIFKGLCDSNWEKDPTSGQYYFHRFFEIQPDLNYRNPEVLIQMTKVLVNWKIKGVDGFRADAVPYIWKEEGTICENLPGTHTVVKFFRAVLDYLQPGSLLLAEACQPPEEVVAYFGSDDECNGAYHFPVMPRIYHAMASGDRSAIVNSLSSDFTPTIPASSQWFMFLRCHDELTLEMVTPEERKFIYDSYVKDPAWDFREGEGISARLAELMAFNIDRILLANSIMMTLPGTPIVYYGDEFAKGNDVPFFNRVYEETGYADTRYLGRGEIDWQQVEEILGDSSSLGYRVYHEMKKMIAARKTTPVFGRGNIKFLDINDDKSMLAYERSYMGQTLLVVQNLSDTAKVMTLSESDAALVYGSGVNFVGESIILEGYGFVWVSKR